MQGRFPASPVQVLNRKWAPCREKSGLPALEKSLKLSDRRPGEKLEVHDAASLRKWKRGDTMFDGYGSVVVLVLPAPLRSFHSGHGGQRSQIKEAGVSTGVRSR